MAAAAEHLTAHAPAPGVVPAAEAAAAGSLASLATQVTLQAHDLRKSKALALLRRGHCQDCRSQTQWALTIRD